MDVRTLRNTTSICPECLKTISATFREHDNCIYLSKRCKEHGDYRLLISRHPWYFQGLYDFYFSLIRQSYRQKDYILHSTNRCNLDCPICLIDSNSNNKDYPIADLKRFLTGKRNHKIDIMGAEPTMRDDLPEIISLIRRSGNIPALHTNGIRLSELSYLERLAESGLREVHLQFEGFDDSLDTFLRGRPLSSIKRAALENLKKLDISTDIVATIYRGHNEKEISNILDYAVKNKFIKEVFFLGCRYLGRAKKLGLERCIMPDEIIDLIEAQSGGEILRKSIYKFQKLYFALLYIFSLRKCFYINHYVIFRKKTGYISIDRLVDLDRIDSFLENLKEKVKSGKKPGKPYILLNIFSRLFSLKILRYAAGVINMRSLLSRGFDLSKIPDHMLIIGFISACDSYSYADHIAKNCGKGAISVEFGIQECGALDNVLRDKAIQ